MPTLVRAMPASSTASPLSPHSSLREVAENIYQVRLPLPFALNHVNCYMLRDDEGWTMLDTGLDQPDVRAAWHEVCTELELEPQLIRQIVLTHMHPDHFGLAGYFQHLTGAPVYLSPRERDLPRRFGSRAVGGPNWWPNTGAWAAFPTMCAGSSRSRPKPCVT